MQNNNLIKDVNNILESVFKEKIKTINTETNNWNIELLIDSFSSLEIILHIEEKFNITIDIEKISFKDFINSYSIKNLINNHLK